MSITALVKDLKAAGEDFEFYPTTKEMVRCIWEHTKVKKNTNRYDRNGGHFGSVLDIGCGTCNFKRWVDEINKPLEKADDNYSEGYIDRSRCATIDTYFVIEKSRILIDQLDAKAVVLGTDFHECTLIDKPVSTIFCNPPYSEYEDWAAKIIRESVCDSIYLIIPERWKNSEKIALALETIKTPYNRFSDELEGREKAEVIGSFDFLNAERSARAKVDIVFIDKSHTSKESGFDSFFDEVFGMEDREEKHPWEEAESKSDKVKKELAAGKNKIEILCAGYENAQQQLFEHFKVICGLDADILNTIGIQKDKVKTALKAKFSGLKNIYWQAAFDCLEEITSRLTSSSRQAMLERFTLLKTVDFTASNVYALIIWVIKNSNQYYKSQMVEFFQALSSPENVKNYVSNKRLFERDEWGYCNKKHDHYTLDYRIICTTRALPGEQGYRYEVHDRSDMEDVYRHNISDICTVANNLGFMPGRIDYPEYYGKKGYVYFANRSGILFEFKVYMNGNVHVKFNKEFIKALNVEVARELGWIHSREDIAREFVPEMAEGAEKYFDRTLQIGLTAAPLMLTGGNDSTPADNGELF